MTSGALELTRSYRQFGGHNRFFTHFSEACQSPMNFAVYLPPQTEHEKLPVMYYLSGLTCSEEIFMTEAQAQAYANTFGVILVVPDTSPRGTGIAGEDDSYDLGSGAGFYVDASQPKWSKHYQMETYVTQELREIVEREFSVLAGRRGIFGHSMGGHGALVLGLRHPDLYQSISAFAPICAPSQGPWGIKAFTEYLGKDPTEWAKYDAQKLMQTTQVRTPMLVDQGLEDEFLPSELFTDLFEQTARGAGYPLQLRRHPGYDHSYFFISTFMAEHLAFHAAILRAPAIPTARTVRHYDCAAEKVFDAWLDPQLMGRFMFGPEMRDEQIVHLKNDVRLGGKFSFLVKRQGQEIDHTGEYLALERPRRLQFTWGAGGQKADSRVCLEITPSASGCTLVVEHVLAPGGESFVAMASQSWGKMADALAELL